jgi:hypothetical protein
MTRPTRLFAACALLLLVLASAGLAYFFARAPREEAPVTPPPEKPAFVAEEYPAIRWEDLVPADAAWDRFITRQDAPVSQEMLDQFMKMWNNAPTNPAIDGRRIRIPGFVAPLDAEEREVREFLLVPYFGACIHVPPPPSNQIIHVRDAHPPEGVGMMSTVWVYGRIRIEHAPTPNGASSYSMQADQITFYEGNAQNAESLIPDP